MHSRLSGAVPVWAYSILFLYLIALNFIFLALILAAWPDTRFLFTSLPEIPNELGIFMVSLGGGGLGSVIAVLRSLTVYTGTRTLIASWIWWFLAQPFVGMSLGFIIYAGIRGGLIKMTASADVLNLYFVTVVAAFTGLFSKQILDRISLWGEGALSRP